MNRHLKKRTFVKRDTSSIPARQRWQNHLVSQVRSGLLAVFSLGKVLPTVTTVLLALTVNITVASEADTLLNASHETSWVYFTDINNEKWYIANSSGVTYFTTPLKGDAGWGSIANGLSVATLNFDNDEIKIRSGVTNDTPESTYLDVGWNEEVSGVEQVGGFTVRGSDAHYYAGKIDGDTLSAQWYFFRVESTGYWYIVNPKASGNETEIHRFSTMDNDYHWIPITKSGWQREFFWDGSKRKVRFSSESDNTDSIFFQKPVDYQPNNFGWRFMSQADYPANCGGGSYIVYHPAADINVVGDKNGNKPVRAVADGEIVGNSTDWGGIVIKHTLNGKYYYSQYGHIKHLDPDLEIGATVVRGQQIGYIGDVGSKEVYHLHFELRSPHHPDPTRPSYWGCSGSKIDERSEVFKAYEAPIAFIESHSSSNVVVIVDDSVTYSGMVTDGNNKNIIDNKAYIDGKVVKERFFKGWQLSEWNTYVESTGENKAYEGNYHYAGTTISEVTAAGKWYFDLPSSGNYEVFVSIPVGKATSQNAKYEIFHNGQLKEKVVDQNAVLGSLDERWVSLGTYYFAKGNNHYVKLTNATGESDRKIAFDAISLRKQ